MSTTPSFSKLIVSLRDDFKKWLEGLGESEKRTFWSEIYLMITPKIKTSDAKEWVKGLKENTRFVLERSSIAYLIVAICNQLVWAGFAWTIPYYLFQKFDLLKRLKTSSGSEVYEIDKTLLEKLNDENEIMQALYDWRRIWQEKLQRTPSSRKGKWGIYVKVIPRHLREASEKLINEYGGNGDKIIYQSSQSAGGCLKQQNKALVINLKKLYSNLKRIPGIGEKKAAMLVRDAKIAIAKGFYIPWISGFKKRNKIESLKVIGREPIPIDVHIKEFIGSIFQQFTREDAKAFILVTDPENPGLVDLFIWSLRRKYCEPKRCSECILSDETKRMLNEIYCKKVTKSN